MKKLIRLRFSITIIIMYIILLIFFLIFPVNSYSLFNEYKLIILITFSSFLLLNLIIGNFIFINKIKKIEKTREEMDIIDDMIVIDNILEPDSISTVKNNIENPINKYLLNEYKSDKYNEKNIFINIMKIFNNIGLLLTFFILPTILMFIEDIFILNDFLIKSSFYLPFIIVVIIILNNIINILFNYESVLLSTNRASIINTNTIFLIIFIPVICINLGINFYYENNKFVIQELNTFNVSESPTEDEIVNINKIEKITNKIDNNYKNLVIMSILIVTISSIFLFIQINIFRYFILKKS